MTEYLCMTLEELALWRDTGFPTNATRPCVDCPLSFHLAEKAVGRCDQERPGRKGGRPRIRPVQRNVPYTDEDERIAARRRAWRDSKRRLRTGQ